MRHQIASQLKSNSLDWTNPALNHFQRMISNFFEKLKNPKFWLHHLTGRWSTVDLSVIVYDSWTFIDHPVTIDRFPQQKIWNNKPNNQRDYKEECTYYTLFFPTILNLAMIVEYSANIVFYYHMVHMIWPISYGLYHIANMIWERLSLYTV